MDAKQKAETFFRAEVSARSTWVWFDASCRLKWYPVRFRGPCACAEGGLSGNPTSPYSMWPSACRILEQHSPDSSSRNWGVGRLWVVLVLPASPENASHVHSSTLAEPTVINYHILYLCLINEQKRTKVGIGCQSAVGKRSHDGVLLSLPGSKSAFREQPEQCLKWRQRLGEKTGNGKDS